MNQEQLEQKLDETRERLLVAVDPLPDDLLQQQTEEGHWSIAAVLAHLSVWEAELVTGLMHIRDGRKPGRLLAAAAQRDAFNAARFAENRDRDLDRIFDDLFQVRRQLERWLVRFKNSELTKAGYFEWLPGRSLADLVSEFSWQHEATHLPAIEEISAAFLEEEADGSGSSIVGLDDIEVMSHDDPE